MGAVDWDTSLPPVGEPREILDFLKYRLVTHGSGIVQDRPTERVFCALAFSADEEVWRRSLQIVDFSQPLFVTGLCDALRPDASYLLRRSAVLILSYLDEQLFRTDWRILPSPDDAKALVLDWSFAVVVALERKSKDHLKMSVVTTLFSFMDEVSDPFYRCLRNPDILPCLKGTNREMSILWVLIQWANYFHLTEDVKTRLESATLEVWARGRRGDPAAFVSTVSKEISRLDREIQAHDQGSFGARVVTLRTRLEDLQEARKRLVKVKKSFLP